MGNRQNKNGLVVDAVDHGVGKALCWQATKLIKQRSAE
jgi:hypothetical protein